MSYYFEKPIVDAKEIYTRFLITTISPLLYEGFCSYYSGALLLEQKYIDKSKTDPSVENPGVLKIFQYLLSGVEKMKYPMLEKETIRIRDNSKCGDIFDDLIKAVIKSHILVLVFNASNKRCKIIEEKMHEKITPETFIHKCYIECSKIFYSHPTLFWHGFDNKEIKDNQRLIYHLIRISVLNAIDRCLPMKDILSTYLNSDDYENIQTKQNMISIQDMIKRDMQENNNDSKQDEGGVKKILDSDSFADNFDIGENNDETLESLIFGKSTHDTINLDISDEKIKSEITNSKQLGQLEKLEKTEKPEQIKLEHNDSEQIKSEQKLKQVEEILKNKRKGKISENILNEEINNNLHIDRKYNSGDNYFGEF